MGAATGISHIVVVNVYHDSQKPKGQDAGVFVCLIVFNAHASCHFRHLSSKIENLSSTDRPRDLKISILPYTLAKCALGMAKFRV